MTCAPTILAELSYARPSEWRIVLAGANNPPLAPRPQPHQPHPRIRPRQHGSASIVTWSQLALLGCSLGAVAGWESRFLLEAD
jgi:hypothetical protein